MNKSSDKIKVTAKETEASDVSHLKPAPCIMLSPQDVLDLGYDCSKMTQEDFNRMARRVGEDEGTMNTWWIALEMQAEKYNLPIL